MLCSCPCAPAIVTTLGVGGGAVAVAIGGGGGRRRLAAEVKERADGHAASRVHLEVHRDETRVASLAREQPARRRLEACRRRVQPRRREHCRLGGGRQAVSRQTVSQ